MKVLVTGANGYIGHHVVKNLLDKNIEVIAADMNDNNIDLRAKVIKADIFSGEQNLYEVFGCPDACIHLAW
ncbi:MAG: NAD(P)-dependent oxidoreductase, partial [Phascolarctobacterium sp.]|nr:NAD(P)-dependent oxidoreductase [Phascolarctobacterium sp.]